MVCAIFRNRADSVSYVFQFSCPACSRSKIIFRGDTLSASSVRRFSARNALTERNKTLAIDLPRPISDKPAYQIGAVRYGMIHRALDADTLYDLYIYRTAVFLLRRVYPCESNFILNASYKRSSPLRALTLVISRDNDALFVKMFKKKFQSSIT